MVGGRGRWRGRPSALLAATAMATAGSVGVATAPASAATPARTITLGIHDGAINMCDNGGSQTTPPTPAQLAAATSSFTDPHWSALHAFTVRFSPPWDIAYPQAVGGPNSTAGKELAVIQACLNAWLTGAGAPNIRATPQIAFKPDPNYRSPDGKFVGVPDIHTYRLAIDRFTSEYSNPANTNGRARVRIISPWGEPDLPVGGATRIFMPKGGHEFADPNCGASRNVNACGPILAAHMWQAVRASCPTQCNLLGQAAGSGVIAGDFSSLGGIRGPEAGPGGALNGSYLDTYRQNLNRNRPLVWAVHPYSDITAFEGADAANPKAADRPPPANSVVGAFARDLSTVGYHQNTQIWLNEISAFQYHNMKNEATPSWNPSVQAAAGHYLLSVLPTAAGGPREPTVTRAYYLNFQAADPSNSRWALVLKGGLRAGQRLGSQLIYDTFVKR